MGTVLTSRCSLTSVLALACLHFAMQMSSSSLRPEAFNWFHYRSTCSHPAEDSNLSLQEVSDTQPPLPEEPAAPQPPLPAEPATGASRRPGPVPHQPAAAVPSAPQPPREPSPAQPSGLQHGEDPAVPPGFGNPHRRLSPVVGLPHAALFDHAVAEPLNPEVNPTGQYLGPMPPTAPTFQGPAVPALFNFAPNPYGWSASRREQLAHHQPLPGYQPTTPWDNPGPLHGYTHDLLQPMQTPGLLPLPAPLPGDAAHGAVQDGSTDSTVARTEGPDLHPEPADKVPRSRSRKRDIVEAVGLTTADHVLQLIRGFVMLTSLSGG